MKAQKIFALCLFLLLLSATGCGTSGGKAANSGTSSATPDLVSAASSVSSSEDAPVSATLSSKPDSSAAKIVSSVGPSSKSFPNSKIIEYKSEGVSSKEKFTLFDLPFLPFITYLPEKGWMVSQTDHSTLIKNKNSGFISITFLKVGISRQEAQKEFDQSVKKISGSDAADFEQQKKPQWAISSLYLWKKAKGHEGGSMTWAILGLRGKQYFYICTHDSDDVEGDYPLLKAMFQEWRWKDTKEPLGYSL